MPSLKELFFDRIEKQGDCWVWTGAVSGDPPLPVLSVAGRSRSARRIALELAGREIPSRTVPSCENRLCVNPDHLVHGVFNVPQPRKLTEDQVQEILELLETGEYSHYQIADKFGVARETIYKIAVGKLWKHVKRERFNPENFSARVPGYYISRELMTFFGLSRKRLTEVAQAEGWETYKVQTTYFYRAEDIEDYIEKG